MVQKVHQLLLQRKETLAVVESCTGGLLSYWLTALPNASQFFLGSIISYSNHIKRTQLKIPAEVLKKQGAVNSTVCRLMAQSIIKLWGSHWALSITGVAGPSRGDKDPPIGVVFIGLAGPNCDIVQQITLDKMSRQDIRYRCALFALDFIYSSIK